MISSQPIWSQEKSPSVLFLGAHCDDIEIGCGATILKLVAARPDARVQWVTFSANDVREVEHRQSAGRFLHGSGNPTISVQRFRNGYFPQVSGEIKDFFEALKKADTPDMIFTHHRDDLHQDHRTIAELTWNTFRNHLIFEYEIPKYDGGLGSPNVFSSITEEELSKKTKILVEEYRSQASKQWFDHDSFKALARIRGIECNAPHKLAEAFYCRKMPVQF